MSLLNNQSDDQTVDRKIAPDVLDIQKLIKQNQIKDTALKKASQLIDLLKQQVQAQKNAHQQSLQELEKSLRCQYQIQIQQYKSRNQFLERQLNRIRSNSNDRHKFSSAKKITDSNNLSRASSTHSLSKPKEKAAQIVSSRIIRGIQRQEQRSNTYHANYLQVPSNSSKKVNERMNTSSSGHKNLFQKFAIEKEYCKQLVQDYEARQIYLTNSLFELFKEQNQQLHNVKTALLIVKQECHDFITENQTVGFFNGSPVAKNKRNQLQKNQFQIRNHKNRENQSILISSNVSQSKQNMQIASIIEKDAQKIEELLQIIKKQQKIIQFLKANQNELQEMTKTFIKKIEQMQTTQVMSFQGQDADFISSQSTSFSKSNIKNQTWTSTSPPSSYLYQNALRQSTRDRNSKKQYSRRIAFNDKVQWLEITWKKVMEILKKHKKQAVGEIRNQNRQLKYILDQIVQIVKAQRGVNFNFNGIQSYQIRTQNIKRQQKNESWMFKERDLCE